MTTRTHPDESKRRISIRSLGGEIWAELRDADAIRVDWESQNAIVELVMGVLARYKDRVLDDDVDLPVEPRPRRRTDSR